MMLLVALFATQTEWSFRSQAWHTVAQMVGEETEEVLTAASGLTDAEVEKLLKERGMSGRVLSTGRSVVTGRTELINGAFRRK